jgi:hypothetical protein
MTFGQHLKNIRKKQKIGLREFCLRHGWNPCHWSQMERNILPPPNQTELHTLWATQLGLIRDTPEFTAFLESAATAASESRQNDTPTSLFPLLAIDDPYAGRSEQNMTALLNLIRKHQ